MTRLLILLVLVIFLGPISSFGQAIDSTEYRVQTVDGNVYFGYIVEKQVEFFLFQTKSIGTIQIRFDDIQRIERTTGSTRPPKSSAKNSNDVLLQFEYPQKYAGSPNAFGLEKGTGYYNNIYLVYNDFQIGLSDQFSMGGGFIPITDESESIPMWLRSNLSIPISKDMIHLEVSALNALMAGPEPAPFGAFFSKIAVGSPKNHISIGVGSYYDNGNWFPEPMVHFGGSLKVLWDVNFVTENYASRNHAIYTGGCQVALGKIALDTGIFLYSDRSSVVGFPYLGLIVPLTPSKNKWK
ncbi:hypothetical protein [Marinoscillum furvescens]|uniref:Uncharacterized protein n=1 Tax=Marinoscillum furvescens DSM 4134 TaxID=1122208 RepID=A0A3D9L496_MARFU|nr:hypothetical protein [Marinoscillum furvescens]RED99757.1 hypothetical protein C7460_10739 [Marinoscillum furvescens DSM 4134]